MSDMTVTRRQALGSVGLLVAGSSLVQSQDLTGEPPIRLAPRGELVNVLEFEDQATRKLSRTAYAAIAGSDREAFDRMTLRPRMMVNCMDLDLTTELFGDRMFAPILIGPIAQQRTFHPEGELATARGAAAAKAVMVVSGRSSYPIDEIAAQARTTLWYQVEPEEHIGNVRTQIRRAIKAGCKALCITVERGSATAGPAVDWAVIDQMRQGVDVPVLLKGVMTPEDAKIAVRKGLQGIVVSNYRRHTTAKSGPMPIEVLPSIADAVEGKVPVLVDGSFRRGADMLKALAFGARAVLVGRPPMWGLAAYGADGVQTVLELLQTDLARMMGGCGRPAIKTIDRSVVKIHAR
jgi:4-hydroxymandelate oxidase